MSARIRGQQRRACHGFPLPAPPSWSFLAAGANHEGQPGKKDDTLVIQKACTCHECTSGRGYVQGREARASLLGDTSRFVNFPGKEKTRAALWPLPPRPFSRACLQSTKGVFDLTL